MKNNKAYDADDIDVLDGIDAVRTRPGMYVGDVASPQGYHHLAYEILDNAVDEAQEGYASEIIVTLHDNGSLTIEDNGRGIPVKIHKSTKKSTAQTVLTTLHAGGKFSQKNYKAAGGLHGVGAAVVNALSETMTATIWREGFQWSLSFEKGRAKKDIQQEQPSEKTGTRITFNPDISIMTGGGFNEETLRQRIETLSYLCPGISFVFTTPTQNFKFKSNSGLRDFISSLNQENTILTPITQISGEHDILSWNIAYCWTDQRETHTLSYTNTIPQTAGGHHINAVKDGLWNGFELWKTVAFADKKLPNFEQNDLMEGLSAVISIRLPEPRFSAQTKDRLVSGQIYGPIESFVKLYFAQWLEENPKEAQDLTARLKKIVAAREAGDRIRNAILPEEQNITLSQGKLDDCLTKNPAEAELYIIEGDSAAGSVKEARERRFQALLPLRGKILNIERLQDTPQKAFASQEINAIIAALRCGVPGSKSFNIDKIRYEKIVIMTDADVDGSHIRCLLMAFFYRYYKPLVEKGFLYIAQPPLYRMSVKNKETYLLNPTELENAILNRGSEFAEINTLTAQSLLGFLEQWKGFKTQFEKISLKTNTPKDILDVIIGLLKEERTSEKIHQKIQERFPNEEWEIEENTLIRWLDGTSETWNIENLKNAIENSNIPNPNQRIQWQNTKNNHNLCGPFEALDHIYKMGQNGARITRYKGLGEMNAKKLWSTTLDPEQRIFKRVNVQDAEEVNTLIGDLLGEDTQPRKNLLTTLNTQGFTIDA